MNQNRLILFGSIFLLLFLFGSIYTSLHNIDLAHNAKDLDLVDDNGVVTQDMTQMYNRAFLTICFILPLTVFFGFLLGWSVRKEVSK